MVPTNSCCRQYLSSLHPRGYRLVEFYSSVSFVNLVFFSIISSAARKSLSIACEIEGYALYECSFWIQGDFLM